MSGLSISKHSTCFTLLFLKTFPISVLFGRAIPTTSIWSPKGEICLKVFSRPFKVISLQIPKRPSTQIFYGASMSEVIWRSLLPFFAISFMNLFVRMSNFTLNCLPVSSRRYNTWPFILKSQLFVSLLQGLTPSFFEILTSG